ncbi:peptidylprolyl isomerase [Mucilaginibacter sp. PPCGB 2223]|uniref:FKBP-type peptidyl-prolyl cis-trans isomerase n=1 Tax=Mucilaginibacter sp. PPCGB 2223 TaxID=1886027 RepID=UPI0008266D06|nr:FKBP-type peptidyl-prolyl cis-trans isomerase [Mucilaginibacter sp. PPCGB 2223]OCX52450.1 peptidylprolyl isomerase [Mucilaginibacter sp. PPCGB 2223]
MNLRYGVLLLISAALFGTAKAQTTPDFTKTSKGVLYHIYKSGDTTRIKLSDVITFNFIQKTDKDSVLTSSYANGGPVKIQIQPSQNVGDLMDIFPLFNQKDSAIVKVPTDSLFKGHEESRPPFLTKGSYLAFNIKIERVQSLADAIAERNAQMQQLKDAEASAITKYVADQKLNATTTLSGLKYVVTQPSIKAKPAKGDTVFVNYVGHTLAGKVFDTSLEPVAKMSSVYNPGRTYEPLKLVLGEGQVIQGWEEGLALLNEGSKATFVIPSSLAYGERGMSDDIRPFTPLVFELELVKVKHPHKAAVAKKPVKKTGTTAKKTPAKKK